MNILCVVDKFFPEYSANTLCINTIMNYFKENGHCVDFLSLKTNGMGPNITQDNGSYIIKFDSYITKYLHKNGLEKWKDVHSLKRKIISGINYLRYFYRRKFKYNQLDCINYKSIIKLIKSTSRDYDIIISCCSPFQLHIIANKLLKEYKNAKWFPVFFDPFVYNSCQAEYGVGTRKKYAESILKKATKCFMVQGIVNNNLKNGYSPEYHEKVIEFIIPSLIDRTNNNRQKYGVMELTYAGMFYDNIRNPHEMFKVLSQLKGEYICNILGEGCPDEIKIAKEKMGDNLVLYGQVERSKCIDKLAQSDILINLGNSIDFQTPSKILEYIGFGKPIVNFYTIENDSSLKYLNNYPLAFNFNLSNYNEQDIKDLEQFCLRNRMETLTFPQIRKYMKGYVADEQCKTIYKTIIEDNYDK